MIKDGLGLDRGKVNLETRVHLETSLLTWTHQYSIGFIAIDFETFQATSGVANLIRMLSKLIVMFSNF